MLLFFVSGDYCKLDFPDFIHTHTHKNKKNEKMVDSISYEA